MRAVLACDSSPAMAVRPRQRMSMLGRLRALLSLGVLLIMGGVVIFKCRDRIAESGLPADLHLEDNAWENDSELPVLDMGGGEDGGSEEKPRGDPPAAKKSIIEVAEAEECGVPRKSGACKLKLRERIHVVFVSAMWYREPFTQEETRNMLKSIISQTRCKLWIHFLVAGAPEITAIPAMMEAIGAWMMLPNPAPFTLSSRPSSNYRGYANASTPGDAAVLYSLHMIPTEWVVQRAQELSLFPLAHHAGVPGMCKFFVADILWQVKRAVYLDVDMLFAGDIQDLWEYFGEMTRDHQLLYWMGNNHPEGHNKRRFLRPYCSCQLVLDLDRIRKANLTKLLVTALKGRAPKSLKEYVEDGDQWLFMWICKQYKRICRILPRMWNVSGCSKPVPFLGLNARGKEANGTCWRIVHFNCMGHVRNKKGSYVIPQGWVQPVRWARFLKQHQLRQSKDKRDWKKLKES